MKAEEIKKLVRRVQLHRDRDAADQLIRFYYKDIYAFVYRQTGNMDLAMDLTQEVFISALQSILGYDAHKAGFRTWLYRIASNKIVDFFRSSYYRQLRLKINIDTVVLFAEKSMEEAFQDRELRIQAVKALETLPFELQQILRLKIFDQATFEEVAAALCLPVGTVKTKYYSALRTLRRKV